MTQQELGLVVHTEKRIECYMSRMLAQGRDINIHAIASFLANAQVSRLTRVGLYDWLKAMHPWVYDQILASYPSVRDAIAIVIGYTTAPEAYDGFGTETVEVVGTLDGKPLRKIAMLEEHGDWQYGRNGSGMYPTYTEQEFAVDVQPQRWFQAAEKSA